MTNTDSPPRTIAQLWFRIDKRLALIEQELRAHQAAHDQIEKDLADHEQRLRSSGTLTGILSGGSGVVALIALIRSLLGG